MQYNKILITGAAGFIGSHVFDHFSNLYPDAEITILDKMTYAANKKNIPSIETKSHHNLVIGDLIDLDVCLDTTKDKDLVINLAAESHVDNSFNNSIIFSRSNALGTHTLMEACKQNNVKKIIHVSTDEVYGENIDKPFIEDDRLNPTNPYSASKAAAEIIINSYKYHLKSNILIVRGNNIFGKRQYPEKLIPSCIYNLLKNKPIRLHGNGKHIRCYLSVNDFADAVYLLIKKKKIGTYNIGNNKYYRNIDVAKLICRNLNFNPKKFIKFIKDRPFNDKRYSINISKIKTLGWKPKRNLNSEIKSIIKWYSNNYKIFKFKISNL